MNQSAIDAVRRGIDSGLIHPPHPPPSKPKSLYAQVREYVATHPDATTDEIYDHVRPNFPKVNPRWLKNTVNHYKNRK